MSKPKYPCRECAEPCEIFDRWFTGQCANRKARKRPPKPTPSRAAIMRLAKAVRHEARDNGHWFEAETIEALGAVEKGLHIKSRPRFDKAWRRKFVATLAAMPEPKGQEY